MDKSLLKLIPYTKPYKSHIIWNVIYNILYALFSTISMLTLLPVLEVLFGKTKAVLIRPIYTGIGNIKQYGTDYMYYQISTLTQGNSIQVALLFVVSMVITTFLFKNLFNYLASHHIMHLKNGVLRDLRKSMYDKIIELPISYYSEKRKGDIMARMLGDVNEVQNSFFSILELVVKEPLTIIFALVTMFILSVKLTLFVLIFLPLSGWIISKLAKNLRAKSLEAQKESGFLISIVDETLGGLKVIKSYNAEPNFKSRFNDSVTRLLNLTNSIGSKNNLATPLSEFLGITTIAMLLFYGGSLVLIDKTLEGSAFIVYLTLAFNILTPAKAISKASYAVKNGLAAAERVFEVLEVENEITSKENAIQKNTFESDITIKNINFKYEDENVLKNFSLQVKKGQTVALVGQSGSGKSTIANLLTRFYDVNEGTIAIDGTNIQDLDLQSLRGLMGLVTQDSILFNDTIKANISLGKLDATDDQIIEALKIANAYEFVKDLPKGIHTNIGDSGNKLSGGQKQRLSIARAVLKNPPIMILDEATSALDTESEKFVQIALENMMQNRTSIVIAHRLSTIQKADVIVVMQKGKIVEQGNHEELIALNGVYNKLVTLQSFE
ncbi:ATP-binding cassette, subfamily B, MsbA [Flavobacterium fryxellicola]|uniref:Antibiotic ABC transporter ATP-binding protein n=1 Tax=Flavobacterium fryxellicola TaxID=249352 RepID=A0A167XY25_9FLAO|nr:ABC transporter transmembrane domain-containing protein [Flavobacterium fryxellicola]OAB28811.1 antibiotic ABC transporter ATP-binding protein [Flavobacterium fryxellicola]SHN61506.1 ATP-binding cassette, subfamily B, MsbA [Flavobacterium fryxellicola]